HPKQKVEWHILVDKILETNATNIILLGGEPTLHPRLQEIIERLSNAGRKVYVTTNGVMLTSKWVRKNLVGLAGINISIHHYDLPNNKIITGVHLGYIDLYDSIKQLQIMGSSIRLNCNCIVGYIDSKAQCMKYIQFAKALGINSVRFAELKLDNENFVDLAIEFNYEYGLNDDPFLLGCNKNCRIDDVDINFRQMCGLQTSKRVLPINPEQSQEKSVLYYDGKIYDGWQTVKKEEIVDDKELLQLMEDVKSGRVSAKIAAMKIARTMGNTKIVEVSNNDSMGCRY
ncbi:MAG: radical SAM protein, partial [SAR202 cluster bacterium]|nr:radical SAM protein [SAR202 cluster bacterium]